MPTQLIDEERGHLHRRAVARTPSSRSPPTRLPGPMPSSARISASGRERSRGWLGQAEVLEQLPAHRQRRRARQCRSTRCRRGSRARRTDPTTSIGLLEARIEAGEVGEVRAVLAVGVHDHPVVAAPRPSAAGGAQAGRVERRPGSGLHLGHAEIRQGDLGEPGRRHRCPLSPRAPRAERGRTALDRRERVGVDAEPRAHLPVGPRTRTSAPSAVAQAEVGPARAGRPRDPRRPSSPAAGPRRRHLDLDPGADRVAVRAGLLEREPRASCPSAPGRPRPPPDVPPQADVLASVRPGRGRACRPG